MATYQHVPQGAQSAPRSSRRSVLGKAGAGVAAGALAAAGLTKGAVAAQDAATPETDDLEAAIGRILSDPRYRPSRLGLHVADRETGETVFDIRGDEWFLAASTTKLWPGSAALNAYGPDFRFETPVYRTGEISSDGALAGDLILVASGDPTMGGRDTEDGTIAYTPIDHINATAFPGMVTLTPQDPLAGLNDLAAQVAEAGIRHVSGDVIIDDRLFPRMDKDGYVLSPIWVNDNLIDFVVKPGEVGEEASMRFRPVSAAYRIESYVRTVAPGEPPSFTVSSPAPGALFLEGQIPADLPQAVPTWQIDDPSVYARTLLIEALDRAGVTVESAPIGNNPADRLPDEGSYTPDQLVALHTSLPFSENLKLIMKTSHNQHADKLVFLLALNRGETSYDAGMTAVQEFVEQQTGIDPATLSLSDGRGNEFTDLFSPRTVTQLLAYMATRPDFPVFFDTLPVLGVDGTETDTVPGDSPVAGQAAAKSGMTVAGDLMNQRAVVMTRALAGFLTGRSGREMIFGLYLNNVPLAGMADVLTVITEHGAIVEEIYSRT